MKEHVRLHRFFTSFPVRTLRLLLVVGLFVLVLWTLSQGRIPNMPLFFLSLMIMWEVFFHFSLSILKPEVTVLENDGKDFLRSFTHPGIDSLLSSATTDDLLRRLRQYPQVRFMHERLLIEEKDIAKISAQKDEVIKHAFATAKEVGGTYVTTMDICASILLLSEPRTKLLFAKDIKPDDLKSVLLWARSTFSDEEVPEKHEPSYGYGFGEFLVTGWTPETEKYTTDFTRSALKEDGSIIGRETEYRELLDGLAKPELRNVLIVGEAGVGKERLVTALAKESFAGRLSGNINHKRIITLMVGQLLAGADNRSELETRLQTIIAELSHSGNIILSLPELQEIMGESSYNLNLSGALLPYLKNGNLPIIATMTKGNYKTYMEKNSLREVFSVIHLEEPDNARAEKMLFQKVFAIEHLYSVILPYTTVRSALALCKQYLPDDVLPGSAVRLLSDAAQHAGATAASHHQRVVLPEHIVALVEAAVHAPIAEPQKEEKALLLHLEEKLHERVIGQDQAISVLSEAMRRLRSGVTKHERPISFLFLGPTGVGKTETAKALAAIYYGGVEKILRLDMSEYVDSTSVRRLLGAPPGSGTERGELTDRIHDNPYSLVLLDEFEKAHPNILDLFLQVLSDGRLTDNKGRTVSFTNTIIIATSNAGSEFIREEVSKGIVIDKAFQGRLLETLQTAHLFKPELLNRFDGIVTFSPLSETELEKVTMLLLGDITKQLAEQDIQVAFEKNLITSIIREGYDEQFGARPLKRYIQDTIEDMLAKMKLEEKVKRGDTVTFTTDTDGKIAVQVNGK